jgi:RimJ/RimL family protein N-acetyltransferase
MSPLNVRVAGLEDMPEIIEMSRQFYLDSDYPANIFDPERVEETLLSLDGTPHVIILALDGDRPCGMLIGVLAQLSFSRLTVATELAWYLEPEFRRTRKAFDLLNAYEHWAKNVVNADCIQMVALSALNPEKLQKLYERRGYQKMEETYVQWLR